MDKRKIKTILDKLEAAYPDAECALNHRNVFELLIAVVLSAQTTDAQVNIVTPALFEKYPTPSALGNARPEAVEKYIKRIGMYHQKANNIVALSKKIAAECGGEVPGDFERLIALPGVGRKTANVVLSVGFGEQHIAVDTHVFRVANRIGLVSAGDVLATEEGLMACIPEKRWTKTHHSLIFHGRRCCHARKPDCENCPIEKQCEKVGI